MSSDFSQSANSKQPDASSRAHSPVPCDGPAAGFVWEIIKILGTDLDLSAALQSCVEAMVKHLSADLARIWVLPSDSNVLQLKASAGRHTHIDGPRARVPVDALKIGLIASEGKAHISNDLQNDPSVGDPAWAKREGFVAFAGYPLKCQGKGVGVVAMFSKQSIPFETLGIFELVAGNIALRIDSHFHQTSLQNLACQLQTKNTELLAAHFQSERLIESAPQGILVVNQAGLISRVNRQIEEMFGFSRAELLGQPVETLIPHAARSAHPGTRATFFANPQSRAMGSGRDLRALRKDGSEFSVEIGLNPIQLGSEFSVLCSIADITERKRAENKLREAARLKSEFLANMSHEVRTPMNVLIGMSNLLLETNLNPDQRDLAESMRKGAESLLVVVNDMLDFSKIEAGKLEIEPVDFLLHSLVEDVATFLSHQARQKGLQLTFRLDPAVPEFVRGDAIRVRQVLTNLLNNAVKFTKQGTVTLTVFLVSPPGMPATIRFEVLDTGIGISSEVQARLFQPFTQADGSTTRNYGGTGLGLVIAKRLTEAMSGTIGVESATGQGSLFWFQLPFASPQEPRPAQQRASATFCPVRPRAAEDNSRCPAYKAKILLVEDNVLNQKLATRLLAKHGYQCDVANNGAEAVTRFAGNSYELVLMDCQMPVMDGFQATAAIRKAEGDACHTPIVALTAHSMLGYREKCLEAGMDDYVSKPINEKILVSTIEHWLLGTVQRHDLTRVPG